MKTMALGRPSKFTEEARRKILWALRLGNYRIAAAEYAGVADRTLCTWLAKGRDEEEGLYADFYRDVLELPITGGFSHGTYFQASTGVIEVIQDIGPHDLRDMLLAPSQSYQPPKGGFLLIEVRDLGALRRRVERAGVAVIQDTRDWPWLFRDFKVADPSGNVLCFFSRLRGWEAHHSAP